MVGSQLPGSGAPGGAIGGQSLDGIGRGRLIGGQPHRHSIAACRRSIHRFWLSIAGPHRARRSPRPDGVGEGWR